MDMIPTELRITNTDAAKITKQLVNGPEWLERRVSPNFSANNWVNYWSRVGIGIFLGTF